ncbi:sulfatase-like hydrolase/transferase [Maribellus comscasis]|nr:sulfatase-like hydrolase/transferase [Maribellus comscasis]
MPSKSLLNIILLALPVVTIILRPTLGIAQNKPNILFILTDDLGKEWVSSYGAEEIKTPNIDNLAETGLMFENFYSTPQCTPTRVSLMTGQYPFRNGWINHWDVPRWGGGAHFDWNKNPGIARIMQSAGYKTAAAGKWQINDFRVQPEAMVSHGFDDYCMWTGYETGNPASAERYWDPYIHTKEGSKTCKGRFGEDIFSDFLIDFMKKNKDEPLFLYYAMCLTHTPFTNTPAEPDVTEKYDCHKAMVRYMDFCVGKLTKALDDLGIRENTIIIYTTDNGTTGAITGRMNGREVQGGKTKTTENGICEPFVVNCPGLVPSGKATDALGDLTDILPTCAELGGAELPQNFVFDGISLADVILGKTSDSKRKWIMAMGGNGNGSAGALSEKGLENQYRFRDRVVRDKEYKLFVSTERKPEKLISILDDPGEKNNLLQSNNPNVKAAYEKLWNVVLSFPEQDNDPHYVALPKEPWDKEVTVKSQIWKK